ncbi:hypothetical protein [Halobacillus sp. K22]|uniref:hypothetical protein n=1 Tax=Halobacillus sp. K22 TaxID=3457431 RepID=UPI003FCE41FA
MSEASILVVEDEEKIARVLELELEYEGYKVVKAKDGLEGLQQIREHIRSMARLEKLLKQRKVG